MGKRIDDTPQALLGAGEGGKGPGGCLADHLRLQIAPPAQTLCCANTAIFRVLGGIKVGKHWGVWGAQSLEMVDERGERGTNKQNSV